MTFKLLILLFYFFIKKYIGVYKNDPNSGTTFATFKLNNFKFMSYFKNFSDKIFNNLEFKKHP